MFIACNQRKVLINLNSYYTLKISESLSQKNKYFLYAENGHNGYSETLLTANSRRVVEAEFDRILDALALGEPVYVIDHEYVNLGFHELTFDNVVRQCLHPDYDRFVAKLKNRFNLLDVPWVINDFELTVAANNIKEDLGNRLYQRLQTMQIDAETHKLDKGLCSVPECFLDGEKGEDIGNMMCQKHWNMRNPEEYENEQK